MPRKRDYDLTGKKFNCFTVLRLSENKSKSNEYLWECKCDCGEIRYLTTQKVKKQESCGCKRKTANNMSGTKLYNIWNSMKQRCYNPNDSVYKWYGGKGVSICKEWKDSFVEFQKWSYANGYKEGLSIERVNSNGNYEPSNCEWITRSENSTRSNIEMSRMYKFNDEEMSLKDWSEKLGIKYKTLHKRLTDGWSIEKAFMTKVR